MHIGRPLGMHSSTMTGVADRRENDVCSGGDASSAGDCDGQKGPRSRPRTVDRTVLRLLHGMGFWMQGNYKTREGKDHPDRDC
jgi:hypothetical protein